MPTPSASGPDETPPLSERERAILAEIEQDLTVDAPALARAMSRPMTTTIPVPHGVVQIGVLVAALLLVLAVTGLIPAVVWALIAVFAAMVLVPWLMLRTFERFDSGQDSDRDS
jgi:hypothetical protein